ncbi:MAG: glycoside hydrolase family 127 protein [Candidatus Latescibacteria bacterium]|nr:glycoside hydrolase family 127 protein [Candidatus Latescibacterota bacterium]
MPESVAVGLQVVESAGIARRNWPVTRGVPLPRGAVSDPSLLGVKDAHDRPVPAQFRVLSRWPDRSLKWVLTDFQADVPPGGESTYTVCQCGIGAGPRDEVRVHEDNERLVVSTGPLRFAVNRRRFSLVETAALGRTGPDGDFTPEEDVAGPDGDAWVGIRESFLDEDGKRYIYGMGGDCLASLAEAVYDVSVEEAGPIRAVIRCEGAFEADLPMHHYAGYRPFRFVTRIYAYAGRSELRVLHTVVAACNPRETEVEEIGLRVPVSLSGSVNYRVAASREIAGVADAGESLLLSQRLHNHFRLERRQGRRKGTLAEGDRTEGWITCEDGRVGLGVGLRHMPEEYPKALGVSGIGDGIDVYCWKDPDGKRLSLKRYSEAVAWDEGEGVYADGTGTSKTTEFFVCYYRASESASVPDCLRGWLDSPHVSVDPVSMAAGEATGGFQPLDAGRFPKSERMMSAFLDWLQRNIELGAWYGFLDWGDALVAWDQGTDDWRFYGRWGWCNSEWDPRHGVWVQYMRTGNPRHFLLGEAMTRHSVDVDTCHYHPFRPYMVGGCFRHSVDHFGDESCASHTFLDGWMDYYYLTGDLRTLEVIREAGEFLSRYRWTEDPAFSFSLRSIANTLRGLLYVYEVTGEERFKARALAVYETIARGQNEDGSWHKRFQVSTAERLSDQRPYGMATEGTTLAVEMGTAAPFTDAEFRKLRGDAKSTHRVLPVSEQKGYQTHYLMVGLELLHRLTNREDVANVYLRAVDWFCGLPEGPDTQKAIQQRYGGILCRHLGYAYRMTGNRRYLEIGQSVLQVSIEGQDWGDDPKRHGAVEMSPMHISLLFFGVPYFLGALSHAGMEEE